MKTQEINQQYDPLFLKIDTYEEKCKNKNNEKNESKQKTQELIKLVSDSIQKFVTLHPNEIESLCGQISKCKEY